MSVEDEMEEHKEEDPAEEGDLLTRLEKMENYKKKQNEYIRQVNDKVKKDQLEKAQLLNKLAAVQEELSMQTQQGQQHKSMIR